MCPIQRSTRICCTRSRLQMLESLSKHSCIPQLDELAGRGAARELAVLRPDGLVISQLYDIIRPGIVHWKKVHRQFSKLRKFMERLENCNYAVELGRRLGFSLVGIAGADINEGNATLTLALIWQLMRAYTLSVLTRLANTGNPIIEKEIVQWVNNKLQSAGKASSIRSFQDEVLTDGKVVIDLKPGSIHDDLVLPGGNEEENLANAKYGI